MTRADSGPLIFIAAGEPSGDRLGAALMRGLVAETGGAVRFMGVGGPAMAAEGLESLFDLDDISVMGFSEVVPKIPLVLRRIRQTADAIVAAQPDAVVTIDAQGFSKRVAQRVRGRIKGPIIHYVAPSVWAWKPWRARQIAQRVDHLMCLLPFEPPYFTKHGLSADFVGHPVAERVALADDQAVADLRAELAIPEGAPVLVLLPGSRRSEVRRLLQPFADTAAALHEMQTKMQLMQPEMQPMQTGLQPMQTGLQTKMQTELQSDFKTGLQTNLHVIVPSVEKFVDKILHLSKNWPFLTHVLDPRGLPFDVAEQRKFATFKLADAALAASGTVSLELAACGVPTVIGYKASRLTEFIARRLININTATLTNLIVGEKIVPEFFQDDCEPEKLTAAVKSLLSDGAARQAQILAGRQAAAALGDLADPPSRRAARSVLRALAGEA